MHVSHRRSWWAVCLSGLLLWGVHLTVHAQADEARARKIVGGVCFVCHGMDGNSASELFPRLAGQHAEYIARQLEHFKSGQRKSPTMADMVAKLTPDEMLAVGRYFEKQSVTPDPVKEPDLAAMGRYVYLYGNRFSGVPACASCHGPKALGTMQLPRLAGQHAPYLDNQLKQFHQRERTNDNAVMHAIVSKMTALEMAAVAEFLSGQ
jgi:cytochrome c553